jgi:protein ImuA
VIWIGRALWPYGPALWHIEPALLARSIFIDPPDDAARLWAIDLALRCGAFAAVIADGSAIKMAHSRRLQLAAASGNAVGLLARPPWEHRELSAAATRWRVQAWRVAEHEESAVAGPRWLATLVRCKGRQVLSDHGRGHLPRRWVLEQDRDQGVVRVLAELVDRPDAAALSARRAV